MSKNFSAIAEQLATPVQTTAYLDAKACGRRYGFSWRHWLRLVDSGRAPQPIRFGRLVRWRISALERWDAQGCPPVRPVLAKKDGAS
jgi:predicted DNA-binding transcriptional regulator AlpA